MWLCIVVCLGCSYIFSAWSLRGCKIQMEHVTVQSRIKGLFLVCDKDCGSMMIKGVAEWYIKSAVSRSNVAEWVCWQ